VSRYSALVVLFLFSFSFFTRGSRKVLREHTAESSVLSLFSFFFSCPRRRRDYYGRHYFDFSFSYLFEKLVLCRGAISIRSWPLLSFSSFFFTRIQHSALIRDCSEQITTNFRPFPMFSHFGEPSGEEIISRQLLRPSLSFLLPTCGDDRSKPFQPFPWQQKQTGREQSESPHSPFLSLQSIGDIADETRAMRNAVFSFSFPPSGEEDGNDGSGFLFSFLKGREDLRRDGSSSLPLFSPSPSKKKRKSGLRNHILFPPSSDGETTKRRAAEPNFNSLFPLLSFFLTSLLSMEQQW